MILAALLACGPSAPAVGRVGGEIFGATWSVVWVQPGEPADDRVVADAAASVFARVDQAASTWRADSDLRLACGADGGRAVSGETAAMVRLALDVAASSGGAFDPTVQPLVELWGLHGARRTAWPTPEELAAARASVGWERVRLSWRDGVAWLDCGGTALDLSALAPGYASDALSLALSALGVTRHMVDVGGELLARGRGPSGGSWRVGIDAPVEGRAPGEELIATAAVSDRGLATSGNYRNHYEIDGGRVVHELDPRTGLPAEERVLSATVVAPDAATADAWATALMVLGESGLARLSAWPEVDALLVVPAEGGVELVGSSGMGRWTTSGVVVDGSGRRD